MNSTLETPTIEEIATFLAALKYGDKISIIPKKPGEVQNRAAVEAVVTGILHCGYNHGTRMHLQQMLSGLIPGKETVLSAIIGGPVIKPEHVAEKITGHILITKM